MFNDQNKLNMFGNNNIGNNNMHGNNLQTELH